ncbi:MAG: two-component sensor histidine kinase [Deltaproteobacteria bacterium]|nr:two-component sensor histidine kinase [Deltaproteobacteria bacterium]
MPDKGWFSFLFRGLLDVPEEGKSHIRYRILRRNMFILMGLVTFVPLLAMAVINFVQYQSALEKEILNPMRTIVSKTKHSFELFLAERLSAVSFITFAYSYEELADEKKLNQIFSVMKREFEGFIDLGLIDSNGIQVSYVGPYDLKSKSYDKQIWFHEVQIRGSYVSDVFMGYRDFPHIVMAVQRVSETGRTWIIRATVDTKKFESLISSMGLDSVTDAFLINGSGVFQTPSRFYGKVMQKFPFPVPPVSYEANVIELLDPQGREINLAYSHFIHSPYILILVKPRAEVMRSWYTLKGEMLFVFVGGVSIIFLVVFHLTKILVQRVQEAEEKREMAFREIEHTQKLSSIGRLAAGVAHEINNPLAIINEKAGLMKDIIEITPDFPNKDRFLPQVDAIKKSVDRCRGITHRLLGFARRMEVHIELLDLNEVIQEVLGFLEKEAMHRNVNLNLQLVEDLPRIESDRGQLQQVFLNILNNAFAAVQNGGVVAVTTWDKDAENVAVSVQDNGCGMSQITLKHIFEPFFTTKKGYGTGLGLSITYGVVKKLGGDIDVESREGEGTKFTVYLPKKSEYGEG